MWKFVAKKCHFCGVKLAGEEPKDVAIARRKAPCPKCGRGICVTEVAVEPEPELEPKSEPELEPEPTEE